VHSIAQLLRRNGFVDVTFMHFHPIATGSGWRAAFVNPAKNACFHVVRALALGSAGALNLDNLFVAARKGAAAPAA
jgi:hypothetical protein